MALFNSVLEYSLCKDMTEQPDPCYRISLHYDDAFGARKHYVVELPALDIIAFRVGGTATSSIVVSPGYILQVPKVADRDVLTVLSRAQVLECVYPHNEMFTVGDEVFVAEHMCHNPGEFGKFDYLATKRKADFRLNSIRLIGYNTLDEESLVVYIDPYTGQVNKDGLVTTRLEC